MYKVHRQFDLTVSLRFESAFTVRRLFISLYVNRSRMKTKGNLKRTQIYNSGVRLQETEVSSW